jgi:Domain of unknown function (DUF1929)
MAKSTTTTVNHGRVRRLESRTRTSILMSGLTACIFVGSLTGVPASHRSPTESRPSADKTHEFHGSDTPRFHFQRPRQKRQQNGRNSRPKHSLIDVSGLPSSQAELLLEVVVRNTGEDTEFELTMPEADRVTNSARTKKVRIPMQPNMTSERRVIAPVADSWSTPIVVRTPVGHWASPVHAALMGDGSIMFLGTTRAADPATLLTPSSHAAWMYTPGSTDVADPASMVINPLDPPAEFNGATIGDLLIADDFICMGAAHTADGRLLISGGTRFVQVNSTGEQVVFGIPGQSVFGGGAWSRLPGEMVGLGLYTTPGRWYPTVMRLPDGKMMTLGGSEFVSTNGFYPNLSIETIDPATNTRAVYSPQASTSPLLVAQDYTHAFVLPKTIDGADIIMVGEFGFPVLANSGLPDGWIAGREPRPGSTGDGINFGVSTALLPIRTNDGEWGYGNGSILLAGGKLGTPAVRAVDVFDPAQPSGWKPSVDLMHNRHHPSSVLLPDGRTLLINGHDPVGSPSGDPAVTHAQYVDPRNQFALSTGASSSGVVRGYHSIALLLPDGRVLVGGGRDQVTSTSLEKPTLQYYSPDYISKPRPLIGSAPTSIGYSNSFALSVSGGSPAEVVLMSLGSMTHSIDMDQRSVQLIISSSVPSGTGVTTISVAAPSTSQVAPPGDYMLFVLDGNHVPSIAKIVRLS